VLQSFQPEVFVFIDVMFFEFIPCFSPPGSVTASPSFTSVSLLVPALIFYVFSPVSPKDTIMSPALQPLKDLR